jgi:hypothetical protein
MLVKVGSKNYNIIKSKNKNKKYDVYYDGPGGTFGKKLFSFGASGYEHYYDRLGLYSNLNHLDKKRRELYYKRHNKNYGLI